MLGPMETWLGALLRGDDMDTNTDLAIGVLGVDGLGELRAWFSEQPHSVVTRERIGAIHACIWMAQADRETHTSEIAALQELIAKSDLPWSEQSKLLAALYEPLTPETIAADLRQPQLRELILALAWELAHADGRLEDREQSAHEDLAAAFEVTLERSGEIRAVVLPAS